MRVTSKRVFYAMLALIISLAGASIGGVIFGGDMLKKQSDKLVSLKLDNRVLDEQQTLLIQAKKDIEKYTELESIAKVIVPQEKDQARTVREIVNLAAEANISLTSITFPASTLGSTSGASTSTTTPSTTTKTAVPPITQVQPVTGITGLYQLLITVSAETTPVPYIRLIDFLNKLEQNRRTSQVTTITVQPSPKDHNLVTFNLTLNVFIKP